MTAQVSMFCYYKPVSLTVKLNEIVLAGLQQCSLLSRCWWFNDSLLLGQALIPPEYGKERQRDDWGEDCESAVCPWPTTSLLKALSSSWTGEGGCNVWTGGEGEHESSGA